MDINIRSHMSLCRHTKDVTFGCRAALRKKKKRISFGDTVSHHPEPSVVLLFLNHCCTQKQQHISPCLKCLSCHIVLAIYSCRCFCILINTLVSLLSQEKYNSLLPEVTSEVIALGRSSNQTAARY